MKRKIYDTLLHWKQTRNGTCAMLIDGARRVGKSYIAREFAQNEYKSYIFIDFNNADKQLLQIFEDYLTHLDDFFLFLSAYFKVTLYERDSLIVFDEVQLYPKARAAIKYLVADGRYDYLETGSLMSINANVRDIVIPSEEKHIKLYPMDFEEFTWAIGESQTFPVLRDFFNRKKPLGPLHRSMMNLFRKYLLVGGMPQAVQTFVNTENFSMVDDVKRDILTLYRADISKYAAGYESKVRSIFDQIPAELQRHEKKFRFSNLKKTARFREYESSFLWLDDAMVINTCYASTEPTLGLRMRRDNLSLKCYMADTGLLISHAFDEKMEDYNKLYVKLLLDKLEINQGMLMENIVAQMLRANNHPLYFFSQYSKSVAKDRMEIDFLILKTELTNRHNICPVEVKSTSRYTLNSLQKFRAKFAEYLSLPYIIHTGDFKLTEDICYLPVYMTPLL